MLSWRVMGEPGLAAPSGEGQMALQQCVSSPNICFHQVPSNYCHPRLKIDKENFSLVSADVKLSDEAQKTNYGWSLVEQDPCGLIPWISAVFGDNAQMVLVLGPFPICQVTRSAEGSVFPAFALLPSRISAQRTAASFPAVAYFTFSSVSMPVLLAQHI